MIKFAVDYDGPIAVRYPRGEAYTGLKEFRAPICLGKSEVIHEGSRVALLAVGSMVKMAEEVQKQLKERMDMSKRDYNIDSYHRDDDNNVYQDATYNIQGDFILQRAGNETDTWISQPLADYTVNSITSHRIEKLNESYQELLDQGVKVFFTFSPKNRNCLTEASTFEARQAVQNKLREELIIPVISDFEDSILPGTDFYLIDNHLSSEAARSRSQRVIHDLKTNISFSEDESLKAL